MADDFKTNTFADIGFFHEGTQEEKISLLAAAFIEDLPKLTQFKTLFKNLRDVRKADAESMKAHVSAKEEDFTIQDLLDGASPQLAEKFALEALNDQLLRAYKTEHFIASLKDGAAELRAIHALMQAGATEASWQLAASGKMHEAVILERAAKLLGNEQKNIDLQVKRYDTTDRENAMIKEQICADAPENNRPSR